MNVFKDNGKSIFNHAQRRRPDGYHYINSVLVAACLVVGMLLITAVPGLAQEIEWSRTYGGFSNDAPSSILETSDNGFIISGLTYSYGAGEDDAYIIKTDSEGFIEWSQVYGFGDRDWINSIKETSDGGYIAIGLTYNVIGAGSNDAWLLRLNADGDTLWTRTYGGTTHDGGLKVIQTQDGGFLFVGYTYSWGAGYSDGYIVRTDENGDTLWTRVIGGFSNEDLLSVEQLDDGNYIMLGWTYSFGHGNADFWAIKMDDNGDTLWTNAYGGNYLDAGHCVQVADDGGYLLGGFEVFRGDHTKDYYVIKINENGEVLWEKNYGGEDSELTTCGSCMTVTNDGGFTIVGYTTSYVDTLCSYYAVRANADGDTLWTRVYGGEYIDEGAAITTTSDGGLIIAGYSYSFGSGNADIWVVKCSDDFTAIDDNYNFEPTSFSLASNYPNPFNSSTNISFSCQGNSSIGLNIYNISGQIVRSYTSQNYPAGNHCITWNGTDNGGMAVSSGVYFYEIISDEYNQIEKMLLIK